MVIDVFIGAPNNVRLTEGTRFWNASGFSIQLGGGGASLNVDSLISLLQGGVSFDTVGSDLTPVEDGHVFELYPSETVARQNLFEDEPGERLILDTDFDGSVRGLQPGAAVEYHGIKVGEVQSHAGGGRSTRTASRRASRSAPRSRWCRSASASPARTPSDAPDAGARPPREPGRAGPARPARRHAAC